MVKPRQDTSLLVTQSVTKLRNNMKLSKQIESPSNKYFVRDGTNVSNESPPLKQTPNHIVRNTSSLFTQKHEDRLYTLGDENIMIHEEGMPRFNL